MITKEDLQQAEEALHELLLQRSGFDQAHGSANRTIDLGQEAIRKLQSVPDKLKELKAILNQMEVELTRGFEHSACEVFVLAKVKQAQKLLE